MKILIMNFTRLGDLIQTAPLVNGLKKKYPDSEIDYAALSSFSGILNYFDNLNEIISFDDKILTENIKKDLWNGYFELKLKLDYINAKNYDLFISPIVSEQSSVLGSLIKAKKKLGMFKNQDGEQEILSPWTAFHLANEHHLGDRTFNLTDIFSGTGELDFISGKSVPSAQQNFYLLDKESEKAENFIKKIRRNKEKIVAFHIGASQSNKAWETEKFRVVIEGMLQYTDCRIVLLGAYKERGLLPYFSDIDHERFHVLIDKTKLGELVSLMKHFDLLVTNDTGPMHIAAASGTEILNLSLGPVSLWETGPYSEKAVIMQANIDCHPCKFDKICSHLNCHNYITPDAVFKAIVSILEKKDYYIADERIDYWQTTTDIFGLKHNVPLKKRKIRKNEFFFEAKRCVWGMTMIKNLDPKLDWIKESVSYLESAYFIDKFNFNSETRILNSLTANLRKFTEIIRQISSLKLKSEKSIKKINRLWENAKIIKEKLFAEAKEFSIIYDFFYYAIFLESSFKDSDFNRLIQKTLIVYDELTMQLNILIKFINYKGN